MKNQTPDDRFDEKFYNVGDGVGGRWLNGTPDEIKSFLHSEIDLAVKEYQEEANEMIEQARIDALEQAAKAVERMKVVPASFGCEVCSNCQDGNLCNDRRTDDAHNSALTSAADIIRKLKNN